MGSFPTETIKENSVILNVPKLNTYKKGREYIPSKTPVFYNPLTAINRDIAVLILRVYQRLVNRSLRICEPFSGCGVRGIRYAKEVQNIDHILLNDNNPQAARLTRLNIERNELLDKVTITNYDTNVLLGSHSRYKKRFDVIDLDPFGSPSPFLDSAVRAMKKNGLLALTATDMAPLCGVKPLACLRKYLGKPMRTDYCHEIAIRLLINSLVLTAVKHNLGVDILFVHSTNHYIRVYTEIVSGSKKANDSMRKLGYISHCFKCLNRNWISGFSNIPQKHCSVCGGEMDIAGPLWIKDLFNEYFCKEIFREAENVELSDNKRVFKLLRQILHEMNGPPTYFGLDQISEKLKLPGIPRSKLITQLVELGYQATETHFNPKAIRTNAPINVIKRLVKEIMAG
jgi:tRNA (guanine26-N2/guanine27-N2)-dimethyltransferase